MNHKPSKPLEHAKNQIRGSANPISKLSELRPKLSKADLIRLLEWAPTCHRKGQPLFRWQFPKQIPDMRRQGVLRPIATTNEVIWAGRRLLHCSEKINAFRKLADQFERDLLLSNSEKSILYLDEIESYFGTSLWLIENRIAVLQAVEGIESQKGYAASVRQARGGNDLVSYLAYCMSHRNEPAVTVPHYISQISASVAPEKGIHQEIRTYVLFRATGRYPETDDDIASILRYEENSSILDLYETFIRLATWTLSKDDHHLQGPFLCGVRELALSIADTRLQRLLLVAGVKHDYLKTELHDSKVAKAFLGGHCHEAISILEHDNSLCGDLSALILEARVRCDASSPLREEDKRYSTTVVNLLRAAILRSESAEDALTRLAKIVLNFQLLRFSSCIRLFLLEHTSCRPIPLGTLEQLSFFVCTPVLTHAAYRCLPNLVLRENYRNVLRSAFGDSPMLYAAVAASGDLLPDDIQADRKDIADEMLVEIQSERFVRIREYTKALSLSTKLLECPRPTIRRKGLQFYGYALLGAGQIPELTDFIARTVLEDKSMIRNVPVKECAEGLDKKMRKILQANLTTSIVLDLYSRNVSDALDSERAFAYEDFLVSNGMERPSDLAGRVADFPQGQLTYYLRYICIPAVMERSSAFTGTRELEDERLKVLALLVRIDPDSSIHYSSEINAITRRKKIRQGVMHVEQSKISVDGPALRRWAHVNIKESFSRYKTFLSSGLADARTATDSAISDAVSDSQQRDREGLDVPANEVVDLLGRTIHALFYEFTTNPEHGLDCYLSIRIRHGPLYGQLRSPLEKHEIISQRESESLEYNTHPSWLNNLRHLDNAVRLKIIERLKQFSKDYDAFINHIANDLVQVKSSEKKDGLFVITDEAGGRAQIKGLGIARLATFVRAINEETTFDEFLDSVFELFWESVEQSLKNIRGVIDTSLKYSLALLFGKLEEDVVLIAGNGVTPDLNRSIREAKTSAQEALDRVKEWFRLSRPLVPQELAFEDIVDIALQSVRAIHPEFEPAISIDVPQLPLVEGMLERLFDIFQIIFDNIGKHCGITQTPRVSLRLAESDELWKVTIENEVAPGVRTADVEAKLERIRQSITKGLYQSGVRMEGGSGLFKLRARVGTVSGQPLKLDFGFASDALFFVNFELVVRHIGEGEV